MAQLLAALGIGAAETAPALTATAGTGAGSVLAPAAGGLGGAFLPGIMQAAGSGVLAAPGAAFTAGVPATTGLLGAGGQFGAGGILPQAGMGAMHGIEQLARALPQFALGGARGVTGLPPEQFGWNPQTIGNLFGQLSRPMGDQGNQDQTLALLLQEVLRRRGMV